MTRTDTAFMQADDYVTAVERDARTPHPLVRGFARFVLGAVLAAIMFVFVAPLTLPWIVTAYVGGITVLGTTLLANR
jgi:hypothetical protein